MNGTRVPGTAKIFKYGRVSAMNLCGQTNNSKSQHTCMHVTMILYAMNTCGQVTLTSATCLTWIACEDSTFSTVCLTFYGF